MTTSFFVSTLTINSETNILRTSMKHSAKGI